MRNFMLLVSLGLFLLPAHAQTCSSADKPFLLQPIADWEVIVRKSTPLTDRSPLIMTLSNTFLGKDLTYRFKTNDDVLNAIDLNAATSELTINSNAPGVFPVTVTATNRCGSVSTTFKVKVIEKEA